LLNISTILDAFTSLSDGKKTSKGFIGGIEDISFDVELVK